MRRPAAKGTPRSQRALLVALWIGLAACHGLHRKSGRGDRHGSRAEHNLELAHIQAQLGEAKPILDLLERELRTNFAQLEAAPAEPKIYFLAYDLVESRDLALLAKDGALIRDEHDVRRTVDVDVRVGTRMLDNSHSVDGDYESGRGLGSAAAVTIGTSELSVAHSLWLATESQYHEALAAYRDIESSQQLRSEGRKHPDFTTEKPLVRYEAEVEVDIVNARERLRPWVVELSAILADHDEILSSQVYASVSQENRHFVTTEGTRVQSGRSLVHLVFEVHAQADDGMRLQRVFTVVTHRPEQLPTRATLVAQVTALRDELLALRAAPLAEPYTGPAVLEGKAAGVFFHEIFGHRLEGHRQKDDFEGQTFTDQIGKRVLPEFIDVIDDPTAARLGETPLAGHYFVDDEGVSARPTVLVDEGKLKTFLLSRSPVVPFVASNGHGRRAVGHRVVARQGNLIVSARKSVSSGELREELIDEIKRQRKPYGLLFKDIEGGYTLTDRQGPQAFKVEPLMVYRVFADGRPDQLVRGVEIVGTPLSAFERIVAADDRPAVFNGMCFAESGWVPVSAVSPSLLLRTLEVERSMHDRAKPPLLPPPKRERRGAS